MRWLDHSVGFRIALAVPWLSLSVAQQAGPQQQTTGLIPFSLEPSGSADLFMVNVSCSDCTMSNWRGLGPSTLTAISEELGQLNVSCTAINSDRVWLLEKGGEPHLQVVLMHAATAGEAGTFRMPISCPVYRRTLGIEGQASSSLVAGSSIRLSNFSVVSASLAPTDLVMVTLNVSQPCQLSPPGAAFQQPEVRFTASWSKLNMLLQGVSLSAETRAAGNCHLQIRASAGSSAEAALFSVQVMKYNSAPTISVESASRSLSSNSGLLQINITDSDCGMPSDNLRKGEEQDAVSVKLQLARGRLVFPVYMHWAKVNIVQSTHEFVAQIWGPLPSVNAVLGEVEYEVERIDLLRITVEDSAKQGANGKQRTVLDTIIGSEHSSSVATFGLSQTIMGIEDDDILLANITWPGESMHMMNFSMAGDCSALVQTSQLLFPQRGINTTLSRLNGREMWQVKRGISLQGTVKAFQAFAPAIQIRCPDNFFGEANLNLIASSGHVFHSKSVRVVVSPEPDALQATWQQNRVSVEGSFLRTSARIDDVDKVYQVGLHKKVVVLQLIPALVSVCVQFFHGLVFQKHPAVTTLEGVQVACSQYATPFQFEGSFDEVQSSLKNVFIQRRPGSASSASVGLKARYKTSLDFGEATVQCDLLAMDPPIVLAGFQCSDSSGIFQAQAQEPFRLPLGSVLGTPGMNLSVEISTERVDTEDATTADMCRRVQVAHDFIPLDHPDHDRLHLRGGPSSISAQLVGLRFHFPDCGAGLWQVSLRAGILEGPSTSVFGFVDKKDLLVAVSNSWVRKSSSSGSEEPLSPISLPRLQLSTSKLEIQIPSLHLSLLGESLAADTLKILSTCCPVRFDHAIPETAIANSSECSYSAPIASAAQHGSIAGLHLSRLTMNSMQSCQLNFSMWSPNLQTAVATAGVDVEWKPPVGFSGESTIWANAAHSMLPGTEAGIPLKLDGGSSTSFCRLQAVATENCAFIVPGRGIWAERLQASGTPAEVNQQLSDLRIVLGRSTCNVSFHLQTSDQVSASILTTSLVAISPELPATVAWESVAVKPQKPFAFPGLNILTPKGLHSILNIIVSSGELVRPPGIDNRLQWHQHNSAHACMFGSVTDLEHSPTQLEWRAESSHDGNQTVFAYAVLRETNSASTWKAHCALDSMTSDQSAMDSGFVRPMATADPFQVAVLPRFLLRSESSHSPSFVQFCGSAIQVDTKFGLILSKCLAVTEMQGYGQLRLSIEQQQPAFNLKDLNSDSIVVGEYIPVSQHNLTLTLSQLQVLPAQKQSSTAVLEVALDLFLFSETISIRLSLFEAAVSREASSNNKTVRFIVGQPKSVCVPTFADHKFLNSTRAVNIVEHGCNSNACSDYEHPVCLVATYKSSVRLPYSGSSTDSLYIQADHNVGSIQLLQKDPADYENQQTHTYFQLASGLRALHLPVFELTEPSGMTDPQLKLWIASKLVGIKAKSTLGSIVHNAGMHIPVVQLATVDTDDGWNAFSAPWSSARQILQELAFMPLASNYSGTAQISLEVEILDETLELSRIWNASSLVELHLPLDTLPRLAATHNSSGVTTVGPEFLPLSEVFVVYGESPKVNLRVSCISCTLASVENGSFTVLREISVQGSARLVAQQLSWLSMRCPGTKDISSQLNSSISGRHGPGLPHSCLVVAELLVGTQRQVVQIIGQPSHAVLSIRLNATQHAGIAGSSRKVSLQPQAYGNGEAVISIKLGVDHYASAGCLSRIWAPQPMCSTNLVNVAQRDNTILLSGKMMDVTRCLTTLQIDDCGATGPLGLELAPMTPGLVLWPTSFNLPARAVDGHTPPRLSITTENYSTENACKVSGFNSSGTVAQCAGSSVVIGEVVKLIAAEAAQTWVKLTCDDCHFNLQAAVCSLLGVQHLQSGILLNGQVADLRACLESLTVASQFPALEMMQPFTTVKISLHLTFPGVSLASGEFHIFWTKPNSLPCLKSSRSVGARTIVTNVQAISSSLSDNSEIFTVRSEDTFPRLSSMFERCPFPSHLADEPIMATVDISCGSSWDDLKTTNIITTNTTLGSLSGLLESTLVDTAMIPSARLGILYNENQGELLPHDADSIYSVTLPKLASVSSFHLHLTVSTNSSLVVLCPHGGVYEAFLSVRNASLVADTVGKCGNASKFGAVYEKNVDNEWVVVLTADADMLHGILVQNCVEGNCTPTGDLIPAGPSSFSPFSLCVARMCTPKLSYPLRDGDIQRAMMALSTVGRVSVLPLARTELEADFVVAFHQNGTQAHVGEQDFVVTFGVDETAGQLPVVSKLRMKYLQGCAVTGKIVSDNLGAVSSQVTVLKDPLAPFVNIRSMFSSYVTVHGPNLVMGLGHIFSLAYPASSEEYVATIDVSCNHLTISSNYTDHIKVEHHPSGSVRLVGPVRSMNVALGLLSGTQTAPVGIARTTCYATARHEQHAFFVTSTATIVNLEAAQPASEEFQSSSSQFNWAGCHVGQHSNVDWLKADSTQLPGTWLLISSNNALLPRVVDDTLPSGWTQLNDTALQLHAAPEQLQQRLLPGFTILNASSTVIWTLSSCNLTLTNTHQCIVLSSVRRQCEPAPTKLSMTLNSPPVVYTNPNAENAIQISLSLKQLVHHSHWKRKQWQGMVRIVSSFAGTWTSGMDTVRRTPQAATKFFEITVSWRQIPLNTTFWFQPAGSDSVQYVFEASLHAGPEQIAFATSSTLSFESGQAPLWNIDTHAMRSILVNSTILHGTKQRVAAPSLRFIGSGVARVDGKAVRQPQANFLQISSPWPQPVKLCAFQLGTQPESNSMLQDMFNIEFRAEGGWLTAVSQLGTHPFVFNVSSSVPSTQGLNKADVAISTVAFVASMAQLNTLLQGRAYCSFSFLPAAHSALRRVYLKATHIKSRTVSITSVNILESSNAPRLLLTLNATSVDFDGQGPTAASRSVVETRQASKQLPFASLSMFSTPAVSGVESCVSVSLGRLVIAGNEHRSYIFNSSSVRGAKEQLRNIEWIKPKQFRQSSSRQVLSSVRLCSAPCSRPGGCKSGTTDLSCEQLCGKPDTESVQVDYQLTDNQPLLSHVLPETTNAQVDSISDLVGSASLAWSRQPPQLVQIGAFVDLPQINATLRGARNSGSLWNLFLGMKGGSIEVNSKQCPRATKRLVASSLWKRLEWQQLQDCLAIVSLEIGQHHTKIAVGITVWKDGGVKTKLEWLPQVENPEVQLQLSPPSSGPIQVQPFVWKRVLEDIDVLLTGPRNLLLLCSMSTHKGSLSRFSDYDSTEAGSLANPDGSTAMFQGNASQCESFFKEVFFVGSPGSYSDIKLQAELVADSSISAEAIVPTATDQEQPSEIRLTSCKAAPSSVLVLPKLAHGAAIQLSDCRRVASFAERQQLGVLLAAAKTPDRTLYIQEVRANLDSSSLCGSFFLANSIVEDQKPCSLSIRESAEQPLQQVLQQVSWRPHGSASQRSLEFSLDSNTYARAVVSIQLPNESENLLWASGAEAECQLSAAGCQLPALFAEESTLCSNEVLQLSIWASCGKVQRSFVPLTEWKSTAGSTECSAWTGTFHLRGAEICDGGIDLKLHFPPDVDSVLHDVIFVNASIEGSAVGAPLRVVAKAEPALGIWLADAVTVNDSYALALQSQVRLSWNTAVKEEELIKLYILGRGVSAHDFKRVANLPAAILDAAAGTWQGESIDSIETEVRTKNAQDLIQQQVLYIAQDGAAATARILMVAACLQHEPPVCTTMSTVLHVDFQNRGEDCSLQIRPAVPPCSDDGEVCPVDCMLGSAVSLNQGYWWPVGRQFDASIQTSSPQAQNKHLEVSVTTRAKFGIQQIKASKPSRAQQYQIDMVVPAQTQLTSANTFSASFTTTLSNATETIQLLLGGAVTIQDAVQANRASSGPQASVEHALRSLSFIEQGLATVSVGRFDWLGPVESQRTIRFRITFESRTIVVRSVNIVEDAFLQHSLVDSFTVQKSESHDLEFTGTFDLVFGGFRTTILSLNSTAAEVQWALEQLDNVQSVHVSVSNSHDDTASARMWQVTFLDRVQRHVPLELGRTQLAAETTLQTFMVQFPLGVPAVYSLTNEVKTMQAKLLVQPSLCNHTIPLASSFAITVETTYGEYSTPSIPSKLSAWTSSNNDVNSPQFGVVPAIQVMIDELSASKAVQLHHQAQLQQIKVQSSLEHAENQCEHVLLPSSKTVSIIFERLPWWILSVSVQAAQTVGVDSKFEATHESVAGEFSLSLGGLKTPPLDALASASDIEFSLKTIFLKAAGSSHLRPPEVVMRSLDDWHGMTTYFIMFHEQPADMAPLVADGSQLELESTGARATLRLMTGSVKLAPGLFFSRSEHLVHSMRPTSPAADGSSLQAEDSMEHIVRRASAGDSGPVAQALSRSPFKLITSGTSAEIEEQFKSLYVSPPQKFSGELRLLLEVCSTPCSSSGFSDIVAVVNAPYAQFTLNWDKIHSQEDSVSILPGPQVYLSDGVLHRVRLKLSSERGQLKLQGSQLFQQAVHLQNEQQSLSFTSPVDQLPSLAQSVVFQPEAHQSGLTTVLVDIFPLKYSCSDRFFGGSPKGFKALALPAVKQAPFAINLSELNDAPFVLLPSHLAVEEDSSILIDGIVVSDVDGRSYTQEQHFTIIIVVSHGTLTVQPEHGVKVIRSVQQVYPGEACEVCKMLLKFGDSGKTDPGRFIELLGPLQSLQAILKTLVFTPFQDFSGLAFMYLAISDMSNASNGISSAVTNINVTASPDVAGVVLTTRRMLALEDSAIAVPGIKVVHPDTNVERTSLADPLVRLLQRNTSDLPIFRSISTFVDPPALPTVNVSLGVNFGGILLARDNLTLVHHGCDGKSLFCIMSGSIDNINDALRYILLVPGRNVNSETSLRSLQMFISVTASGPSFLEPLVKRLHNGSDHVAYAFWQDQAMLSQMFSRVTPSIAFDLSGMPTSSSNRTGAADEAIEVVSILVLPTFDSPSVVNEKSSFNSSKMNRDFVSPVVAFNPAIGNSEETSVPVNFFLRDVDESTFASNEANQDLNMSLTCTHCRFWRKDRRLLRPASWTGIAMGIGSRTVRIEGSAHHTNIALQQLVYTPDVDFFGNDTISLTVCRQNAERLHDLHEAVGGSNMSSHQVVPGSISDAIQNALNPLVDTVNLEIVDWDSVLPAIPAEVVHSGKGSIHDGSIDSRQLQSAINYLSTLGTTRIQPAPGYVFDGKPRVVGACDSQQIQVQVRNEPEPPTVVVNRTSVEIIEDTNFVIRNEIRLISHEMPDSNVSVRLTPVDGYIELIEPSHCDLIVCNHNGSSIGLTGPAAALNAVLADGLQFLPLMNNNFLAPTTPAVIIEGMSFLTNVKSSETISISVLPSNDAPFVELSGRACEMTLHGTCPVELKAEEDSILSIPLLHIQDVDSSDAPVLVTVELEAEQGQVGVRATPGVLVAAGVSCSEVVLPLMNWQSTHVWQSADPWSEHPPARQCLKLHGKLSDINAALESLTFNPSPEYSGISAVFIAIDDFGYFSLQSTRLSQVPPDYQVSVQKSTTTIIVHTAAVNDAPVIEVLEYRSFLAEDGALRIDGISISDPDAQQADEFHLVTELSGGRLLLGSAPLNYVLGSGTEPSRVISVYGELRFINLALSMSLFVPDPDVSRSSPGPEPTLHISVNDLGNRPSLGTNVTVTAEVVLHTRPVADRIEIVPPASMIPVHTCMACQESCEVNNFKAVCTDENMVTRVPLALKTNDSLNIGSSSYTYEVLATTERGQLKSSPFSGVVFQRGSAASAQVLAVSGTMKQLSYFLEHVKFVPEAYFHGLTSIILTIRPKSLVGANDESFSASQLEVPVFVKNVNHPTVLYFGDVPLGNETTILVELQEDTVQRVGSLALVDPDSTWSGTVEDIHVSVVMQTTAGLLAISAKEVPNDITIQTTNSSSLELPAQLTIEALGHCMLGSTMVMTGPLKAINQILSAILYAPAENFNHELDGMSFIHVEVIDKNKRMLNTIEVFVAPLVDPLEIHFSATGWVSACTATHCSQETQRFLMKEDIECHVPGISVRDVDGSGRDSTSRVCMHFSAGALFSTASPSVFVESHESSGRLCFSGGVEVINSLLSTVFARPGKNQFGNAVITTHLIQESTVVEETSIYVHIQAVDDEPFVETAYSVDQGYRVVVQGGQPKTLGALKSAVSVNTQHSSNGLENKYTLYKILPVALDSRSNGIEQEIARASWQINSVSSEDAATEPAPFVEAGEQLFFAAQGNNGSQLYHLTNEAPSGQFQPAKLLSAATEGSQPKHLTVWGDSIFFSAVGRYLDWILQDDCQGIKLYDLGETGESLLSRGVHTIAFVAAQDTTWDPSQTYSCPSGYTWAQTAEVRSLFNPKMAEVRDTTVYSGSCGWQGLDYDGRRRKRFRMADSPLTGAFLHSGLEVQQQVHIGNFEVDQFAGIVCLSNPASERSGELGLAGRELWKFSTATGRASIVADLEAGSAGSNPEDLAIVQTAAGELLVFSASVHPHGREAFVSGGNASSTKLLKDINPGIESSNPTEFVQHLTPDGAVALFAAESTTWGSELWRSDGSSQGTMLVADIRAGSGSSSPKHLYFSAFLGLTIFSAAESTTGREVWVTNGLQSGTYLLVDINPGSEGSNPDEFIEFDGFVLFVATDKDNGREIWRTDGTASGTILVHDIATGTASSFPERLSLYQDENHREHLIFWASAAGSRIPQSKASLWVLDSDGAVFPAFQNTSTHFEPMRLEVDIPIHEKRMAQFGNYLYMGARYGPSRVATPQAVCTLETCSPRGLVAARLLDEDSSSDTPFSLRITSSKGTIALSQGFVGSSKREAGLHVLYLSCTLEQCNEALADMVYHPETGQFGNDQIVIQAKTPSLTSNSTVLSSSGRIPIVLLPSLGKLVWRSPPAVNTRSSERSTIQGIILYESHSAGNSDSPVVVSISARRGELTVFSTDGVHVMAGTGFRDKNLTIAGPIDDINASMQSVLYECRRESACYPDDGSPTEDMLTLHARRSLTEDGSEAETSASTISVHFE